MPRGRPKGSKNKSTINKLALFEASVEKQEQETVQASKTELETPAPPKQEVEPARVYKNTVYCELCNSPIHCGPHYIQLNSITGKASWHRNCAVERLQICDDCCKELNGIVDDWILKKNPSLNKWKNS